jgi:hypothetical protein
MKKLLLSIGFVFFITILQAQWAFNGNNIYNTNTLSVGIGTSSLGLGTGKLQILTTTNFTGSPDETEPGIRLDASGRGWGAGIWMKNSAPTANGHIYGIYANEHGQLIMGNEFTHISTISILPTGQMGIGTGINSLGTFKLAVEGKIGAREVQVTNVNPWPDFVFKPTYQLLPLLEVEKFVKQNNHLPGVPSAEDVKDGIELGKMNAILLQKIEELTLYLIEIQKQYENLKQELQSIKKD